MFQADLPLNGAARRASNGATVDAGITVRTTPRHFPI